MFYFDFLFKPDTASNILMGEDLFDRFIRYLTSFDLLAIADNIYDEYANSSDIRIGNYRKDIFLESSLSNMFKRKLVEKRVAFRLRRTGMPCQVITSLPFQANGEIYRVDLDYLLSHPISKERIIRSTFLEER